MMSHALTSTPPETATIVPMPPFYNDLTAALAHAWAQLAHGATDRTSAFHTPVVANVGLDGAPQQRSMILRDVDTAARTLRFYTDTRSAKMAGLGNNPQVSVLAYDARSQLQLRLNGRVRFETGTALADNIWKNLHDRSRMTYAQTIAPGQNVFTPTHGAPPPASGNADLLTATARENFCLLIVDIDCLDWVLLSRNGNRRARFTWPQGQLTAQWLAP